MKKTKRLLVATVAILLCLSSAVFAKGQEYHWFFKPNPDARPVMPPPGAPEVPESVIALGADDKRVYLTFDAGYVNENVESITRTLREKEVPAAFFILKQLCREQVPLLNEWSEAGFLVCNHTKTHKNIATLTDEAIAEEVVGLADLYREATGREMDPFFRPPEGSYSLESLAAVEELGYRTVFWSTAYADWDNARQMAPDAALKLLLERTHNGAVILLHPTSTTNAQILPRYIDALRTAGYTFASLTEFS